MEGETRGWTIGNTETVRLRGKEGEVDYRYMPDPDLGNVLISSDMVEQLRTSLPELPPQTVARVVDDFGLSMKDAKTLVSLDDGARLEYCSDALRILVSPPSDIRDESKTRKVVANWVLHEIGGLLSVGDRTWDTLAVTPQDLAAILQNLLQRQITGRTAKHLLQQVQDQGSARKSVETLIDEGGLRLRPLSDTEYERLAKKIIVDHPDAAKAIREKGQKGKIMFFVGQMMRIAEEGTIEAEKAKQVIEAELGMAG